VLTNSAPDRLLVQGVPTRSRHWPAHQQQGIETGLSQATTGGSLATSLKMASLMWENRFPRKVCNDFMLHTSVRVQYNYHQSLLGRVVISPLPSSFS
jgi:hypothetical protein